MKCSIVVDKPTLVDDVNQIIATCSVGYIRYHARHGFGGTWKLQDQGKICGISMALCLYFTVLTVSRYTSF